MQPTLTHSEPTDDRAAAREADRRHYRAMQQELADMGMDLARALHHQTTTQEQAAAPAPDQTPAAQPAPDLTIPFERVARTVRRTVALAHTLDQVPVQPRAEKAQDTGRERVAARARILREVEDAIERRAEGADAADSLRDELHERLSDAADLDDELAERPIADVIATIVRDLGLALPFPGTCPWGRRTPQQVRDLRARAAQLAGVAPPAPERPAPPWPPHLPLAPTRPATGPPPP